MSAYRSDQKGTPLSLRKSGELLIERDEATYKQLLQAGDSRTGRAQSFYRDRSRLSRRGSRWPELNRGWQACTLGHITGFRGVFEIPSKNAVSPYR